MSSQIDQYYSYDRGSKDYPYLLIEKPDDALPVLVRSIPDGPMKLSVMFNGREHSPKSIKKSLIEIAKLLRIYEIVVVLSPEKKVKITTLEELIDMTEFDWG